MAKDYYTAKETAEIFGVYDVSRVYKWIKQGILPAEKGDAGKWQITQAGIDAAVKNLQKLKHGKTYIRHPQP